MHDHLLTLSCQDRVGIVYAVTGYLAAADCNILDSQQFGDPRASRFFMRVHFDSPDELTAAELRQSFEPVGEQFQMDWQIHDNAIPCKTMVLVSKFGHCLNDLLYRSQLGSLNAEVAAVVSNHPDLGAMAASYGVPFHHLPVDASNRFAQEAAIMALIERHRIDLVVLARYMQVLSDEFCRTLAGHAINIHHSFLPSFKGARPYQQAYDRGVKLIGATAHYVTAELDEGPIIDQEVVRVDHSHGPERLVALGRDLESVALARAVQAHAERRVLLNGTKTVVFR